MRQVHIANGECDSSYDELVGIGVHDGNNVCEVLGSKSAQERNKTEQVLERNMSEQVLEHNKSEQVRGNNCCDG